MRKFVSDPLFHFLVTGGLLFAAGSLLKPGAPEERIINVDRPALLEFIQYRAQSFEPNAAAVLLDGLSDAERAQLVKEYVREEALAREAKALGLDAHDYVIRQRMVQKVEFLAEEAASAVAPSGKQIAAFFDENKARYVSPASATMTHVFISTKEKSAEAARAEALGVLAQLQANSAGFNDAGGYGDRFLFHKNYVDRTADYMVSQLGETVVAAIFDPATPLDQWRGPFASEYGLHLIYVTSRDAERQNSLEDMRETVVSDLTEEMREVAKEKAVAEIVAKYEVKDRTAEGL